ncbi:fimbrial protein [Haemophilus influenzae]|nr:Major fimbrial subunit precursor [Haemophilus influenzae]PRJ57288.1 Major fimbrial subunit precursor [Haemophilus influenzae]
MKKTLLGSLILLAFAGNVQAAQNGGADPETAGTVTFFGKVVENTCKVKTENRDMSVVLNDVGKSHFKSRGDTAMPTPFTITLQNCSVNNPGTNSANKVGLYFYSWENADKENDYTLKNMTGDDKAKKVNIQIFKENGVDAIKVVDKETEDFTSQNTNNGATVPTLTNKHISGSTQLAGVTELPLHFIAQYYSTDATVTAGKVQTSVNFEIAYE